MAPLTTITLRLPLRDSLLAVLSGALITHLIFKRWEPTNLTVIFFLLLVLPGALSTFVIPNVTNIVTGVLLTYTTFYVGLITSIVLYRSTSLHPLARYPGPWQARLSNWWLVYKDWQARQHLYIQELHERYGNVVRIGPNELSIRDPEVVSQLMGTTGLSKGPNIAGRAMNPPIRSLLGLSDPAEHARRRRPWTRAFSTVALKEYHPIIHKRASQLTEALANSCVAVTEKAGKGGRKETEADQNTWTDLAHWIAFFTYDFMGDLVFGGGTELIRDGDPNGNLETLKKMFAAGSLFDHIPWLADFAKKLPIAPEVQRTRASARSRTEGRIKRGAQSKDLFYYLSNEDGVDPVTPSIHLLLSDAVLAVGAGADTTASVLSNIFFNLLTHREYYRVLREEVDHFYPPGEDAMDTTHYPKMVWLEAIINETLRIYPVVPNGSQRASGHGSGDRIIGPYYIPDGTQARVHFYSMQRDAANFTAPTSFFPERWIITEGGRYPAYTTKLPSPVSTELSATLPREKLTHNPNAFVPFSFGPANCVGKNLALQEMKMVICNLMQRLDMRLAEWWDPSEWERKMQAHLVVLVSKLPVVVRRREGTERSHE